MNPVIIFAIGVVVGMVAAVLILRLVSKPAIDKAREEAKQDILNGIDTVAGGIKNAYKDGKENVEELAKNLCDALKERVKDL